MLEAIENISYNLIANLIWVILGAVAVLFTIRFEFIRKLLRKVGFNIHFDKPVLDIDLKYSQKTHKTSFVVKNAGNRPAYNVYVYLFEDFLAGASYRIVSLGDEDIRSGVLGAGEKETFLDKNMMFHGCSATSDQEVWIEYSDEASQHYRTVVLPSTPRGDDMKVLPPARIKERLPMLPSMDYQGQKKIDPALRSGRKGLSAKY
jgi:hypothetical protein